MLFGGSVARVFTTIQETSDNLMLFTYLVGLSLNVIIVVQFLLYWNAADIVKKKKQ